MRYRFKFLTSPVILEDSLIEKFRLCEEPLNRANVVLRGLAEIEEVDVWAEICLFDLSTGSQSSIGLSRRFLPP